MKFKHHNFRFNINHFKCLLALLVAWFLNSMWLRRRNQKRNVFLHGGTALLSGNLKAFFDYTLENAGLPYKTFYLAMDKQDYLKLHTIYGAKILLASRISVMMKLLQSACIMTSAGPGIFYLLKWLRPKIRFVDVYHAILLKDFPVEYWRLYEFYSGIFVSSEYVKEELYIKKYGLSESQLFVTGYARVDKFHKSERIAKRVREELELKGARHVIAFAPTWRPGEQYGEIPFGLTAAEFLTALNTVCERIDALLVFRPHIGSAFKSMEATLPRVKFVSQEEYPETNDLLTAVDLVITDWSSIAADFYALIRPVVYVETPMPLNCAGKGNCLERVGDKTHNMDELAAAIEKNLKLDKNALRDMLSGVLNGCYGNTLDGCSARRYDMAIRELLHFSPADINDK